MRCSLTPLGINGFYILPTICYSNFKFCCVLILMYWQYPWQRWKLVSNKYQWFHIIWCQGHSYKREIPVSIIEILLLHNRPKEKRGN